MARTSARKFRPFSSSDLRITIQDGPYGAGAMFIHKKEDCIMVLFEEEFAAMRAGLDLAEKVSKRWHAKQEAS